MNNPNRRHWLTPGARLSLFIVSYVPLVLIMAIQQTLTHHAKFEWGGFNYASIVHLVQYFGFISLLVAISLFGVLGFWIMIRNLERRVQVNGEPATITSIDNKNSETISYLFTYVIPFVFQDLSKWTDVLSVLVLLTMTCLIYINSTMLLINPTISPWYSLYEIAYEEDATGNKKTGMTLSKERFLEEHDKVKLLRIGSRLFYSINHGELP